ncbi:MAG TPA: DUF1581 domain-containing protein, partial [Planctomycetaceae bacterium]|nr:DUF1581 domain-containing protein [Planctomycetaceae bacterium]
TPNTVSVAVNQHPMWTDHAAFPASPWLGLRSLDERRPLFRNLKLTGQPVILRAVHLSDGNALRGWHAPVFGQLSPPPTPTTGAAVSSGWRLIEGVLQAPDDKPDAPLEHLLSYQRPLLAGEAVNYEFSMSRASMKSVRRWGASRFCCSPMAFASIG